MQRRTLPNVSAAAVATTGCTALLGTWQADAAPVGVLRATLATPFAFGVPHYNWARRSRQSTTYVHYPATGNPSGAVTAGRSPVQRVDRPVGLGSGQSVKQLWNGGVPPPPWTASSTSEGVT